MSDRALHVSALPAISLAGLAEVADLQARFESKYLVPTDRIDRFVRKLGRRAAVSVLEIDGQRSHGRSSEYFDSEDLRLYRDHVQGRRRRYKVRTRRYRSDARFHAELKLKDGRGRTLKHRVAVPAGAMTELSADILSCLHDELRRAYPGMEPVELAHSASVRYRRTTLVLGADAAGPTERVTIDRGLVVARHGTERRLGGSHAIVEVKASRPYAVATSALVSLGHRRTAVSKYGLAIASAERAGRSHPWLPAMRLLGGDRRR